MSNSLKLGTRGSKLAMAQATKAKAELEQAHPGREVEIVPIKTSGDRGDRDRLGAFVREIQEALLDRRVDVALHCLKDLPTESVVGLQLSAYLEREDPRDGLIARVPNLDSLPNGAVVGTGSVRRTSQLSARRSDLSYKPLVGNVDTRLRKLLSGEYDAIILAVAGLRRIGLWEQWSSSEFAELSVTPIATDEVLPAPGQAVLVMETRSEDALAIKAVRAFHHDNTKTCADAERAFLQGFGGGCSVPVAAYARAQDGLFQLEGLVAAPNGSRVLKGSRSGTLEQALELAAELVQELREQGASELCEPTPKLAGGAGH